MKSRSAKIYSINSDAWTSRTANFLRNTATSLTKPESEYCANYRVPDLTNPESLARELETLYGYQKQRLFQAESQGEITKHIALAHQILKTLVACNAINAEQDIVTITPQDPKVLEEKK